MKIAGITLFLELLDGGTPAEIRQELQEKLETDYFTNALKVAWAAFDGKDYPNTLIVGCLDNAVAMHPFQNPPGYVRAYDKGSGWTIIGEAHETERSLWSITPQQQFTIHDGTGVYAAYVHARYRIVNAAPLP